jgi:hypothetical protein
MKPSQLFKVGLLAALMVPHAWAQKAGTTVGTPAPTADWVELAAPPEPAFNSDATLPLDMPPHVSVKVGIDPATIAVGGDGVVRYVVVMKNASGSVNAAYEGIRCLTDEVKTYARWSTSSAWSPATEPQWRDINGNMASKHAFTFARQGACANRLAPTSAEIIAAMKVRNITQVRTQKMSN